MICILFFLQILTFKKNNELKENYNTLDRLDEINKGFNRETIQVFTVQY